MKQNRQQLIVGGGYYILAVLTVLFFYKESSVPNEFVEMIQAVLFLGILPMLIIKKGFNIEKEIIKKKEKKNNILTRYNWPKKYVKKQLKWSVIFIWGGSLLFWIFMIQWKEEGTFKLFWKNGQVIKLILINLTIVPVGLLAQEFFFRGFLLEIFRNNFNKLFSVGVTSLMAISFGMILAQKILDWKVLLGMLIVNGLLGLLVTRVRSVIFSFFLQWLGFVALNFWVLWQLSLRAN